MSHAAGVRDGKTVAMRSAARRSSRPRQSSLLNTAMLTPIRSDLRIS